jgi:hypothetical protein
MCPGRRLAALTLGIAVLVMSVSACTRMRTGGERTRDPAASMTYQLAVGTSPDLSGAMALTGRRLRGRVYLFANPSRGVDKVWLFLDEPSSPGSPYRVTNSHASDALHAGLDGTAWVLDTTRLGNGPHTLTAVLDLTDGTTATARASFILANPVKPVSTTRAPTTTATTRATERSEPTGPRVLFGIGPEATAARRAWLVRQAPVRMLSSWYNGPDDLDWMAGWKSTEVPRAYANGYALHLIVFSGDAEGPITTPHGEACGRGYPLSGRFLDDMRRLARIFAGPAGGPRLYVSLFTEFQTYPCSDNAWNADPAATAYYRALKDRYRSTQAIFHQLAPNARVSLSWGGWQARWDDRATGAGRSLFRHFAGVLRASDFQSFQAMATDSNTGDIRAMVRTLGAYGPVMLAHYKPDNGSGAVFAADLRTILTDRYLAEVTRDGLFAMSFMDDTNLAAPGDLYELVRRAVRRYARVPA